MANVAFIQDYGIAQEVAQSDYPILTITDNSSNSSVSSIDHYSKITYSSVQSKFIEHNINSKITSVLPFRIRFTQIQLPTVYGPGNPAPIGIAVIDDSFYVL